PVMSSNEMKPLAMFGAEAGGATAGPSVSVARTVSDVSYTGALGGLLDLVAGRLGISWKYADGNVVFYYLETRRFDIQPADAKYALKGAVTSGLSNSTGTDSSSSGGNSNSGVSGSGGSTMSSTVEMGNDLYKDLKITVESMLTPGVGRLSLNSTTGTMMVTDVPDVVARIGEYLEDENRTLSRQVILKVVTYTVNTDVNDMVGIDWNLIWKSLNGNFGIKLANTNSGVSSDAISGGFNVLDTATGSAAQFAGSSFLLNALSKQAQVSDVKTSTIMTTNMAAAPVLVGQQTTYLKDVTTTAYATGDATVPSQTLTPGSVTTGTNITILPKILKDSDRLMLNMFMDISSLKDMRV
ncbi:PilN family type IVB pilus formation outer membrane protein, partial [Salmonella enterica subsp. enterica serovar Pomona]|nr:PilN family type IVB pilus formation outer membrane protein [Salmonella enterica subsp. enterica serovar Pomona]